MAAPEAGQVDSPRSPLGAIPTFSSATDHTHSNNVAYTTGHRLQIIGNVCVMGVTPRVVGDTPPTTCPSLLPNSPNTRSPWLSPGAPALPRMGRQDCHACPGPGRAPGTPGHAREQGADALSETLGTQPGNRLPRALRRRGRAHRGRESADGCCPLGTVVLSRKKNISRGGSRSFSGLVSQGGGS
jgi:hypothetical protein